MCEVGKSRCCPSFLQRAYLPFCSKNFPTWNEHTLTKLTSIPKYKSIPICRHVISTQSGRGLCWLNSLGNFTAKKPMKIHAPFLFWRNLVVSWDLRHGNLRWSAPAGAEKSHHRKMLEFDFLIGDINLCSILLPLNFWKKIMSGYSYVMISSPKNLLVNPFCLWSKELSSQSMVSLVYSQAWWKKCEAYL